MTVDTSFNILPGSDYSSLRSRPLKSKHVSRDASRPSLLTIVNTEKFGKRITFSSELIEHIGSPENVQLEIVASGISIGSMLRECDSYYSLKQSGKKKVLYAGEVVDELTEIFRLDFSGKTSISFHDVTYMDFEGNPVAYVPLGSVNPFEDEEERQDDEENFPLEDEVPESSEDDEVELQEYADSEQQPDEDVELFKDAENDQIDDEESGPREDEDSNDDE